MPSRFLFELKGEAPPPDPVGGVTWYGLDDTYTSCYFPLYCSIDDLPPSTMVGSLKEFSCEVGEGICTDMRAVRKDYFLDHDHSAYVD